jgi:hypothetical protein
LRLARDAAQALKTPARPFDRTASQLAFILGIEDVGLDDDPAVRIVLILFINVNLNRFVNTCVRRYGGRFKMVVAGIDLDPANTELITSWAKDYWNALHAYSSGGAYVNFMMEDGQERVKATYRNNYDRLLAVKKQYDPSNPFRVNQNIDPSERTGLVEHNQ